MWARGAGDAQILPLRRRRGSRSGTVSRSVYLRTFGRAVPSRSISLSPPDVCRFSVLAFVLARRGVFLMVGSYPIPAFSHGLAPRPPKSLEMFEWIRLPPKNYWKFSDEINIGLRRSHSNLLKTLTFLTHGVCICNAGPASFQHCVPISERRL